MPYPSPFDKIFDSIKLKGFADNKLNKEFLVLIRYNTYGEREKMLIAAIIALLKSVFFFKVLSLRVVKIQVCLVKS